MIGVARKASGKHKAGVVGTNLRRIREKLGLSQQELADRAGVNRVTIGELEVGIRDNPEVRTVEALAQALGVRPSELIDPPVTMTPVEPLLREFIESPHAKVLDPPLSEDEITWLRGLPGVVWIDLPPSLESFRLLIEAHRKRTNR